MFRDPICLFMFLFCNVSYFYAAVVFVMLLNIDTTAYLRGRQCFDKLCNWVGYDWIIIVVNRVIGMFVRLLLLLM